jgi:hypothetical protein
MNIDRSEALTMLFIVRAAPMTGFAIEINFGPKQRTDHQLNFYGIKTPKTR